jgi:hypothetical protein
MYPIAEQFRNGTFVKPIQKKEEFYIGGLFAMQRRLEKALAPFRGAYQEYVRRTDDLPNYHVVAAMWDYVKIV